LARGQDDHRDANPDRHRHGPGRRAAGGIYTTYRHDDRGYVSVGFPLAALQLHRHPGAARTNRGGLVLTSRSPLPHAGHYLTYIDPGSRQLATLEVPGFDEELDVYVETRRCADHAFWVFELPFLVLRFRIRRKPALPLDSEAKPSA
jgi:hypothetical protein